MKQGFKLTAAGFAVVLVCSLVFGPPAFATNGMNMEGYGPIATSMGGASMAYDNGTAAVMNNPATLGLMSEGNRLDVFLGFLQPNVQTSVPGYPAADSTADMFMMPGLGFARKKGPLAYGLGVFAQGGMGTQYELGSWPTFGSPDKVRSELGVGRAIIPLAYDVTKDLSIAVSFDYVWASLDLQMALPVGQLKNFNTYCTGPLCGLAGLPANNWARIDFTGGGADNGAARGTGYAGKLGAIYRISPEFTIGASYHSKTYLDDLETDSSGAFLSAQGAGLPAPGKIIVRDFQWPETYGVGAAWNANKETMIVLDYKRINWHNVMKDFKMTFEGSGSVVNFAIPQSWNNQNIYELGAAYKFTPEFTGRIGANISDNPIPDIYVNYLFPAIEKNHYTVGAGYAFNAANSIDASYAYAPQVSVTNAAGPVPVTTTHSQNNFQIMYTLLF